MQRRSFLAGILAAGLAPAAIGSGILMPVRKVWTPPEPQLIGIDFATGPSSGFTLFFSSDDSYDYMYGEHGRLIAKFPRDASAPGS